MAVERRPSAIWFMLRIQMQDYSCDIAPVSTYRIRVEQALCSSLRARKASNRCLASRIAIAE